MAVFVGDKFIADIKKGSTEISKIYKGKDLVYEKYVFSVTDDGSYKKVITRPWGRYKVQLWGTSDYGSFSAYYSKEDKAFYNSGVSHSSKYESKFYTVIPLGNVMYLMAIGANIVNVEYMGGKAGRTVI